MPPPSLILLDDRLDEIGCLVDICRSRRSRRTRGFASEEPALLRGALVLLSSHIEGFFEELVEDVINAIDQGIQTPGAMPKEIRIRQVLGEPSRWQIEDQSRRWDFIRSAAESPLFGDTATHVAGLLDPGLHTDRFSNPGTTEILSLFKSIGILNCWEQFHAIEQRKTYKNEIDAIVSRRNQVAHGDMNSIITDLDIEAYMKNFRHTATIFSQMTQNHIAIHLPNFCW